MTAVISDWRAVGPARELGEGARLVAGRLLQVDLLAGRLYGCDAAGGEMRLLRSLDVPLGAVAAVAGRPGGWIAAAGTGIAMLDAGDTVRWVGSLEASPPLPVRVNDAVCDPAGRFWAGLMAYEPTPAAGALYRIDHDLTISRVVDGMAIPNGPAFDTAGTVMYLADSAAGVIYRFELDAAGDPAGQTEFARVADGSPDGMVVDAEDHLWSAIWGCGVVHRYAPSGELVDVVAVPARQPTSIAIGDGRIFVTSATHGLSRPAAGDGRTFVADCAVDAAPAAAFRPAGPPRRCLRHPSASHSPR